MNDITIMKKRIDPEFNIMFFEFEKKALHINLLFNTNILNNNDEFNNIVQKCCDFHELINKKIKLLAYFRPNNNNNNYICIFSAKLEYTTCYRVIELYYEKDDPNIIINIREHLYYAFRDINNTTYIYDAIHIFMLYIYKKSDGRHKKNKEEKSITYNLQQTAYCLSRMAFSIYEIGKNKLTGLLKYLIK